ncbi:hypothetical protein [Blastococcus sp. LR1]|uniref:hypothetical protein n=1 Tax=Blastococcus sp. LR1 TaxID=2877000 RepID=UPI001CD00CE1|nr:hypothetical protein [Blastococcus sp. LR1]MCA0145770.1 hypothetical protein [Blastococcus sp. LR1]
MATGRSALLLGVVACVLTGCAQAEAGHPGGPRSGPLVLMTPEPGGPPVPEPQTGLHPEEVLTLPLVTSDMQAVLDEVQARWGDHPELGQSEISLDRTLIILRWHGSPPAELTALAGSRSGGTFDVRVDETRFRDTELGDEAHRLVREHSGVVTSAWPRTEGDGVGLGLDPSVAGNADPAALERLGISSRFPLFPEPLDAPVAASGG